MKKLFASAFVVLLSLSLVGCENPINPGQTFGETFRECMDKLLNDKTEEEELEMEIIDEEEALLDELETLDISAFFFPVANAQEAEAMLTADELFTKVNEARENFDTFLETRRDQNTQRKVLYAQLKSEKAELERAHEAGEVTEDEAKSIWQERINAVKEDRESEFQARISAIAAENDEAAERITTYKRYKEQLKKERWEAIESAKADADNTLTPENEALLFTEALADEMKRAEKKRADLRVLREEKQEARLQRIRDNNPNILESFTDLNQYRKAKKEAFLQQWKAEKGLGQ